MKDIQNKPLAKNRDNKLRDRNLITLLFQTKSLRIQEEKTVFIDNLPKDDWALNLMIKDVNWHIRDLEKKFFEEEDSEVEEDLKQNQNISAAEHNQQLENLKEKSHIQ